MSAAAEVGGVWSAEDTHPEAIAEALRSLLRDRALQEATAAPARVINLIVVVDAAYRGEVANRLEAIGRYHASRTVLCSVEPGRETIDAWATMACDVPSYPGALTLCRERVEIEVGTGHVADLASIVDPILVTDLPTVVWAPHGHDAAVDALLAVAGVVLVDSLDEDDVRATLDRVRDLAERAYVVDLAWVRGTPWRERIAAAFDPPSRRGDLARLTSLTVRHRPGAQLGGVLLAGWLAARLGWTPGVLRPDGDALAAPALDARGGAVFVRLDPCPAPLEHALVGVELEVDGGEGVVLERGEGGLRRTRHHADGSTERWTVLGASRGERGILGEGVRQALLRDPTYLPAAGRAARFAG